MCKEDRSSLTLCNNKDINSKNRYCPSDDSGCACQLQCLASNVDGRKNEVQLVGIDQLASWGIDMREILVESYDNYRNSQAVSKIDNIKDKDRELIVDNIKGKDNEPIVDNTKDKDTEPEIDKPDGELIVPEIDETDEIDEIDEPESKLGVPKLDKRDDDLSDLEDDELDGMSKLDKAFMKAMKAEGQLLALPTCVSAQLDMGDFKKDSSHNRLFPCTCGDWRSSETQTFLKQLGLGMFQPGYSSKEAQKIFTRDCPGVSDPPPPSRPKPLGN